MRWFWMYGGISMRICVVTDNKYIYEEFNKLIKEDKFYNDEFDFYCTSKEIIWVKEDYPNVESVKLKEKGDEFFGKYDLFFSLHSKQIFPTYLVKKYRCINVHPGFNPYNRGWFPQVFSIINKMPVGVTIHEMDDQLDHGAIIYQEKIEIEDKDTSYDVYMKIQKKEVEMLNKYLRKLMDNEYKVVISEDEGNVNLKKDFDMLCELDLDKYATIGEVIDLLRATTFQGYKNAYFIGEKGKKIYVNIELLEEEL